MLLHYFFEIRNRFIFLSLCWVTSTIVAYTNKETLLFLIVKSNSVIYYDKQFYFIATNLTDLFSVYLDLSYFIAFQITIVFGLVQLKLFFLPALYSTERKQFILIYRTCILFWVLSIIFLNKIALPLCWDFFSKFFNHYNYTVTIFLEIKVTEYLGFFITTYYVTVLLGQAFVILFLVINVSKNKLLFVKTTRKLFYLFFLIIATILTPPDVISQLFLAGIFILIFEILIITIILKNLN